MRDYRQKKREIYSGKGPGQSKKKKNIGPTRQGKEKLIKLGKRTIYYSEKKKMAAKHRNGKSSQRT